MERISACPKCGCLNPEKANYCRNCRALLALKHNGNIGLNRPLGITRISSSQTPYLLVLAGIIMVIIGVVFWQFVLPKDPGELRIYNVNVISRGKTNATITWQTDRSSSSQVEYGRSIAYGFSSPPYIQDDPTSGAGVYEHSVTIRGLQTGTIYKFRVKSRDINGTESVSAEDLSFKTLDQLNILPDPGD